MEERILAMLPHTIREIKPNETLWQALYDHVWFSPIPIQYDETTALVKRLLAARRPKITRDGYLVKYSVTYDQCWPTLVKEIAALGVVVITTSEITRFEYKHLPEFYIETRNRWIGRKVGNLIKLPLIELQRKLIFQFGTPYQEEVIQLRMVSLLPQPIAEAISDCIMAVIERRYLFGIHPVFSYLHSDASLQEIIYTARQFGMDFTTSPAEDMRDWESCLVPPSNSSIEE